MFAFGNLYKEKRCEKYKVLHLTDNLLHFEKNSWIMCYTVECMENTLKWIHDRMELWEMNASGMQENSCVIK